MNQHLEQFSSGVILAPELPAGIRPSLRIMLSNFSGEQVDVVVVVNAVDEAGVKSVIIEERLRVTGNGSAATELPDRDIEGRRLEITLRIPPRRVIPSAAIIETARADGSTVLALWIGPSEFSRVASNGNPA